MNDAAETGIPMDWHICLGENSFYLSTFWPSSANRERVLTA
jgi:hypothetical protein